jgi:uncharacterized LabA/DUF88 family protein
MKSCLFIDGGYMEKISTGKLNYRALPGVLLKAAGGGNLLRTYYYDCVPQEYESNKQKFLDALAYIPNFIIRYGYLDKHIERGEEKFTQKMTDVQIALDIFRAAKAGVERVIVVTGDMDLVPALEAARKEFCEVVLVHNNGITRELQNAVDRRVIFTAALQEECRWKNGEGM